MTPAKPRLRPVDTFPVEHEGQRMIVLRDPSGVTDQQLAVSPAAAGVLALFDGTRDVGAVLAAIKEKAGIDVPRAQIERLLAILDGACMFEGPKFEQRRARALAEYRGAPLRDHRHAGASYPAEPDALRAWFDALPSDALPSDAKKAKRAREIVGLGAPHIDLRFGGESNALVHRERVARGDGADTVVVLGTGHMAADDLFTLTRQDYGTPLGAVATDRELADAIARRLGEETLFRAELLHRDEHSVEFQAVFLRLLGDGAAPRMLPVLVGSFHRFLASGVEPYADPAGEVPRFVDALLECAGALGRRVQFVASIDLAHVGPRYGDSRGLTPDEARAVEREDRALLAFAAAGDAEGFFRHNLEAGDARRICGFSALYTLLRLLPGARGRLVRYQQTTFPGTADTVSHCAMVFER